jgi:hypothetical protein
VANLLRNLAIVLALTSIVTGLLLHTLLALLGVSSPSVQEVRWVLILGMPIVLVLSFIQLNLTPARTGTHIALYSLAQLALFLVPFGWLFRHVL